MVSGFQGSGFQLGFCVLAFGVSVFDFQPQMQCFTVRCVFLSHMLFSFVPFARFLFVVPIPFCCPVAFFLSYRGCSLPGSLRLLLFQCCTDSCADVSPVSPQLLVMFFFLDPHATALVAVVAAATSGASCRPLQWEHAELWTVLHTSIPESPGSFMGKRVGSMVGGLLLAAPSAALLQELLLMLFFSLPLCSFPVLQLLLDVPS